MKKVRYALGVIGVAPAIGMMAQGAAVATAHKPEARAKTVSHHQLGPVAFYHVPYASSSCTATSPVVAANKVGSVLKFWWKHESDGGAICIGTVKAITHSVVLSDSYYRVRVWARSIGGEKNMAYSHKIRGGNISKSGKSHFSNPVREIFYSEPVQVCGKVVSGAISNSATCKSVG